MSSFNFSDLFRAAAKLRMLGYPDLANAIVPYQFNHEALLAGKNLIDEAAPVITVNQFQAALEMVLSYLEPMEVTKKDNNTGNNETNEKAKDDGEVISRGTILPPFSFDTPEKLKALVGRIVKLRDWRIVEVIGVDNVTRNPGDGVICHEEGWVYSNGHRCQEGESSLDIIEVLPEGA